jgi:Tol biopolymer transport system component
MSNAFEGAWARALLFLLLLSLFLSVPARCADEQSKSSADLPKVESITQITNDGIGKTNLLADDSNLYITETPNGQHVLARVSLSNDSRRTLSTGFSNVEALDISSDRSRLLIAPVGANNNNNQFWIWPIASGEPVRVGELTGRDAAWSKDGHLITFARGSSLFVADASGNNVRELFKADGAVFSPRISPDSRVVRFTVDNVAQNSTSLWEVNLDGSSPHALLQNWPVSAAACCGNWTSDGRYFIFQVTQNSPAPLTTLWGLAEDAGTPFQLTTGPASFANPSLSDDDKKIWAIGVSPKGEAVKYDPARKQFTALLAGVSATDLDYSPDGKWVTYVSIPDGELYRCRADGTDVMRLTSAPERAALPHWSRDLSQIAYVRMIPGKPWRISLISVAGGSSHDIVEEDQGQIDLNWSPDGSRIMFGYVFGSQQLSIKVVNLKTHAVETIPGSDGLFSPRWSPDGRFIAALTPDFTKVMLFDFHTRKWSTWFAEPAGAVSYPVWSSDSRALYFDDLVTGEESIRRVRVGEHHAETAFTIDGIERYLGRFGLWTSRMPDGSFMFVRDRSTQEVYQLNLSWPVSAPVSASR